MADSPFYAKIQVQGKWSYEVVFPAWVQSEADVILSVQELYSGLLEIYERGGLQNTHDRILAMRRSDGSKVYEYPESTAVVPKTRQGLRAGAECEAVPLPATQH